MPVSAVRDARAPVLTLEASVDRLSVIAPTVEVPEPAMTVIVPLVLTSCERATFPMAV